MQTAGALTIVLVFAVLVEGFVEYFIQPAVPATDDPPTWFQKLPWKRYAAAGAAIALALGYQIDLIAILFPDYAPSYIGMILTGLLISRGANYTHDWIANPIVKLINQ